MTRIIYVVLFLSLGCSTLPRRSNAEVAWFLATVTDVNNPRLRGVIDNVLTDIERRTYVYDDQVRKYAFVAIGRLLQRDDSVRARIRLIARRTVVVGTSSNDGLEFVSVLGALTLLTQVRDGEAVLLNVARLDDPAFQQMAVDDLRYLKAWELTKDVERAFGKLYSRSRPEAAVLASFLMFLDESPATSPSVCKLVMRSKREVASCCALGLRAAIDLEARLECKSDD
jgi:hypothetical protein